MNQKQRDRILVLLTALAVVGLFLLPTGFENEETGETVKVRVLATDDSNIRQNGIIRTGDQGLTVAILSGDQKGRTATAVNHLYGKLELDKVFAAGDTALALLDGYGGEILKLTVVDHWRVGVELLLFLLFAGLLLWYAGAVGARALLSFVFCGLAIWKILLPGALRGWEPITLSLAVSAGLVVVVICLVSGTDRKSLTAICGALAGIVCTWAMSMIFGPLFSIHGAIKPFSETLLYSGFGNLNLTGIFLGGIFLASTGAVMDLSMDIAAAMHELALKKPDLSRRELTRSGLAVGRLVVGTMTTTLLLAYTGGFSSMLMVFIAQGTPILNVLNLQYVAAEIMHILVGSFGLVSVAPLTALLGGFLLAPGKMARAEATQHTQKEETQDFDELTYL